MYTVGEEEVKPLASEEKTVTRLDTHYVDQYDAYMERKKRKKKRLIRRLAIFALVIVLATGGVVAYHMNQRAVMAEKEAEYEQLAEELETLQEEEEHLKEEVELLKEDEYVLDIARTNYFFSKEGEKIFKLTNEQPSY